MPKEPSYVGPAFPKNLKRARCTLEFVEIPFPVSLLMGGNSKSKKYKISHVCRCQIESINKPVGSP